MKLRIKGNSLRLRLLRGEVEQFGKTGRVIETIRFGDDSDARLDYVLKSDRHALNIAARFTDNQITVIIPAAAARAFITDDAATLCGEQKIENGDAENILTITIEKDFVCLDRPNDADNLDAFPHPMNKCG